MSKIRKQEKTAIDIFEKDDQFWTTSLDIAEKFGKRHKDVLKAMRNLECPEDFTRRNFAPGRRKTRAGEEEYYIISRDGFTLLAMGFTGKESIQWKRNTSKLSTRWKRPSSSLPNNSGGRVIRNGSDYEKIARKQGVSLPTPIRNLLIMQ